MVCRWMKEEKCHKEFIIFEDGSEMEKETDQELVKNISQNYYSNTQTKAPDFSKQKEEEEKKQKEEEK